MTQGNNLLAGKRVAIVGGGPGGLTLARLLQLRGVDVRVFERDRSAAARGQGASLDLHEDSGQRALDAAGLLPGFNAVARPLGQQTRIFDKQGRLHFDLRAEHETMTRPEVDRQQLRDLLLASLAPGTVRWGHRLEQVVESADGYRLEFFGQASVQAEVVVGGDGTWSKVREQVSSVKPGYAGVTFVEGQIRAPDIHHPMVAGRVGAGSLLALGDNRGLMAQRNGDGSIQVYAALRVPENWVETHLLDFSQPLAVLSHLLTLFEGWSPDLTELLQACERQFVCRPLYTLPVEQVWRARPGLTLIGDAAHVMTPFTGRGVNMAMLDALELTLSLTQGSHTSVAEAIASYEREMLARMATVIAETQAAQDSVIADDAPVGLVACIREHLGLERGA